MLHNMLRHLRCFAQILLFQEVSNFTKIVSWRRFMYIFPTPICKGTLVRLLDILTTIKESFCPQCFMTHSFTQLGFLDMQDRQTRKLIVWCLWFNTLCVIHHLITLGHKALSDATFVASKNQKVASNSLYMLTLDATSPIQKSRFLDATSRFRYHI